MSAISLKSITGITSITTPAGVDNQLTLHNNNTTEAVKLDVAGNLHFHNHLNITGVSTASNFKTGTSNLHNTGLNVQDLDVDGHTNLDNVSVAGVVTTTGNVNVGVDLDVTDDLTIGGEFNMQGTFDNNKYIDARIGSSNSLVFRSSSGGAGNLVTMLQLGVTGSSLVGNFALGDSSDSSSAAGPEFTLNRNSSSPANADYLGQIKFAGRSSTGVQRNYAKITGKILDVTNGAEDGILEFAHIKNGSQTITGRWRSDSLQLLNDTNLSVAGDTTLTSDLDVDGHTNLDNVSIAGITTFTNGYFDLKPNGGGNAHFRILSTGTGDAGIFFDAANGDISGSDYVFIGQKNNLDFVINANVNAGNIDFQRAGNTQLRIDSSGRLGINQATPASRLHISEVGSNTITVQLTNASTGHTAGQDGMTMGYSTNSSAGFINVCESGSAFTIKTGGTGAANERLRIDGNGRLIFGHTAALQKFHGPYGTNKRNPQIQINGQNVQQSSISITSWDNNVVGYYGPAIFLAKSGSSTIGTNSRVSNLNSILGSIIFSGDDGDEFIKGAMIQGAVDASTGGNDMPGRLMFFTTPDAAQEPVERVRIQSDGEVFIGEGLGATNRSTLVSISGAYQDPAGVWAQVGVYSSDSQAAGKGGSISFGGQDGSSPKQTFAAIKGAKSNGNSGDYAGYLSFYTRPNGAVSMERFRVTSSGHVVPVVDNTYDLGAYNYRWKDLYVGDAHFSNRGSVNEVDGTWGDWTLQEGESKIFMINNRTGKKYSLVMEEE